jgi:ABC-type sugar transport system ATPase subunit
MSSAHVALSNVGKRFGATEALAGIDLTIARGTVHGLVGENGAGKSTLGKIVAGVFGPDAGEVRVNGRAVHYGSPRDALVDGITIVQQEIAVVPQRTALDNVFLGESGRFGLRRRARLRSRFAELAARIGFELEPGTLVGSLRVPERQQVEIMRALAREAELIVFDEPTASLTAAEAERLLAVVRDLRALGTTVVYVSHDLGHVLELADEVTVLRNGRLIRTDPAAGQTTDDLVTTMLGRSASVAFPELVPPPPEAPATLSVRGLARAGSLDDISFDIHAGEIVGLAGLVGSGRTEVARAIFGADARDAGEILIDGEQLAIRSPKDAVRAGIAMLPESRKDEGLLMSLTSQANVTLPRLDRISRFGVLSPRREAQQATELLDRLAVKRAGPQALVGSLSGGNQQKVLFSKWLFSTPRVLLADEPTRGIDIGAKLEIYRLIAELAAGGMAVLLISSELDEILGLAHRTLVMRRGAVVLELDASSMSEEAVLRAAFGSAPAAVAGGGE